MNIWIGDGRLTKDPEFKVVGGGTQLCNFTIAVDRKPDKDGNKKTDFIDCTAFGKLASFVDKYFKKGDGIQVRGAFQSDKYQDKNGQNRTSWSVFCEELHFPLSKGKLEQSNSGQNFTDIDPNSIPF